MSMLLWLISLVETPDRSKKKVLAVGQPGEEISLVFILRVVADVGLVGLPNAGKSTLLAATTLARPDIADYPFTTLMPNLGRLDGDPSLGPGMFSSEATFADLPGLIEGAHIGKELRMYNPDYLERPYIVVFNKIDLPQAKDRLPSSTEEIMRLGIDNASCGSETSIIDAVQQPSSEGRNADVSSSIFLSKDKKEKDIEDYPQPLAIVGVSVLKGIRVNEMLKAIRAGLRKCRGINEALQLSETG
ncbi:hypothetical protein FF1_042461 [Malus domestica]|uniref:probable GTP-binding protein OBGC2 n=1 Tax=Malus domestica TaxID=3750 RepID=UPI003975B6AC